MKSLIALSTLLFLVSHVACFGGSEDKFLKKYAMMKIYESCFGPEVVKQIRKDMKAACAKCAAFETPAPPPPEAPIKDESIAVFPSAQQPSFDVDKLHQAILAYRPNAAGPSQLYRPYSPAPNQMAPFFNPGAYPAPFFYPGYPQQPNQFNPYTFPLLGQSPYYGNRVSRDMDVRAQLEALTSRMSGKVRNVTCVMQELGYLDDNLEPNFQKISERIAGLPVSDELKNDMQDGVTFCQQFSQCVPDIKREKSPLSRELIRPMFFFKCYKHKKLEACIMKDVREKYAGVADEELDTEVELRRTGKSSNLPQAEEEIEAMASSMYEFLYGSESNIDIDSML